MNVQSKINWTHVHDRLQACDQALQGALHPDDASMEATFGRRARQLAKRRSVAQETSDALRLLVFRLGQDQYAFPLNDVAEVGPLTRCTPVPGGPPALHGVISHRGEVRSVVDLAYVLNRQSADTQRGFFMHLRSEHQDIRVRVESLEQVVHAMPDQLIAPEDAVVGVPKAWVRCVHRDGIVILRAEALCRQCVAASPNALSQTTELA